MPREKAQAAPTVRLKVQMGRRGADCLVVATKWGNAHGAKGVGHRRGARANWVKPGGARRFSGRRQPSRGDTSRMNREAQVRICEGLGVKFPGPTRPFILANKSQGIGTARKMRADTGIKPDLFVEVPYRAIVPLHSRVDEAAIAKGNGVVAIEPDGLVKIQDGEILVRPHGQISVEVPLRLLPIGDGPVDEGHRVFGIESDRLVEVLDRTVDPAFAQVGKAPVVESDRAFRIEPDRLVLC